VSEQKERMLRGELYRADDPAYRRTTAAPAEIKPPFQCDYGYMISVGAGQPIAIGDNVWLGGGAIVCPGVAIGEDTVVGAGSVVLEDLPAGVLAAGNPCRVVREL
jgi:NDP-sugar pyrophosphorylase family protein